MNGQGSFHYAFVRFLQQVTSPKKTSMKYLTRNLINELFGELVYLLDFPGKFRNFNFQF